MAKKYRLTEEEKKLLKVVKYGLDESAEALEKSKESKKILEESIKETEELLCEIGYEDRLNEIKVKPMEKTQRTIIVRTFADLLEEANAKYQGDIDFSDIFTSEEIEANAAVIKNLNEEFNAIHHLDKIDWAICIIAGLVAAAIDIILVGIPHKTDKGIQAGSMSNWIRDKYNQWIPADKIKELEKLAKMPYDASNNINNTGQQITQQYVDGLNPYFHRYVSLGHDPLLGLVFGVLDAMRGTMTTLDRSGKFVSQFMPSPFGDRKASSVLEALLRVITHFKSDVNTSMGLPAPLMAVFNLFQFGSVGETKQTIAEIVQGMYYDGYDFIHFCSMAIPVLIIEFGVRIAYAVKRIKEGHSVKDSLPITTNREKRPKLGTMLFTAHSIATAVNAGKVCVEYAKMNAGVPTNPFLASDY